MKMLFVSLVTLFSSHVAQASVLTCDGNYWWIRFSARATTDDKSITSPVAIKISGAPGGTKYWNLTPQTSSVSLGQAIAFAASAPEGTGSMTTQYNGQYYAGTVTVATSFGSYNVPVKCQLAQGFRR